MQYVSGRRINQDFGVPGITTNDTVVNVDGRIAVGIGTSATTDIDTNQIRIRDNIIDSRGVIGSMGYFLTKDVEGVTWTNVPPLGNNSIFLAEDGDILNNIGLQTYTGLNFISDQLLGITTNPDNPGFADIRIDPRWFRDRTPGGGGGIYTTGTVGIGLTQPRLGPVGILTNVKLDVLGDAIFTGIISATSFIGEFNVDTKDLNVSGIASFTGTTDNVIGDTNTGIVQIDGGVGIDKNVSIGASLFVNTNVGIGTSTNLDGNALTINGGDVDILGDDTTVKIGTAVTISNGIVSATTFKGNFLDLEFLNVTGIATINSGIVTNLNVTGVSTLQTLNVSGTASFNGTTDNVIGDTNTGIVQINGGVGIDKNVSIGASLDVNNLLTVGSAVTIGNGIVSATTGDFINLELDNLNVTGFSTFGNTARFNGAVNIFDDLFVSGNISVGGTGVTLDTESIRIEGKELLIGFTTTITPNDTTANAAGIAVASTEGYFLVDLQVPGINTTPNTYKQIKWFKSGTFVGQGTDAFISNQPISIGGTQIGNGQLFAVGDNINFTEDEIKTKNLKVTGNAVIDKNTQTESLKVTGVSTFVGLSTFTKVGIGTTNVISNDKLTIIGDTRLGGVNDTLRVGTAITMSNGIVTATTFDGNFLSIGNLSVSGIATINTGIITDLSVSGIATINTGIVTNLSVSGIATINTGIITDLSVSGIATINTGIVTNLSVSGIATINTGIITDLSVSGIATINTGIVTNLSVSGIATINTGIITDLSVSGIATINTGIVTDLSVSGIATINTGIVTNLSVSGIATINTGIITDLSVSGIATIGNIVSKKENDIGIITSVGIGTTVVYYGDGSNLEGIISGVGIQSSGTVIGTGFTTLNFIGTGNTIVSIGNTVNISINSSEFAGFAQTAGIATNLANGAGGEIVYQSDTNTTAFLTNGTAGQVLVSSGGIGAPSWQNGASTGAIDGITVQDEGNTPVGTANSITTLNFVGSAITSTASGNISTITVTIPSIPDVNGSAGIASTARDVIGGIASVTSLSVSGISTLGTVEINAGVITATSGIVTYYGDGQYLDNIITENEISNQSVAFAQTAGIATNVIGGIASLTSLRVSGISTLGTVKIDAGIITSTTGTAVTYFGNLTGTASTASFATTAFTLDGRVESDFNVAFAQTAGIATNVIGGIASVTSLRVSGISTLGTVKIDAGIITSTTGTAVTYFGNLTGTASTASFATTAFTLNNRVESDFNVAFAQTAGLSTETTRLQTERTFELTGDVVASQISFDGTGNVSLAATIQPNSVALGDDTTGDYVESITGTGNQITVTSGTGEGSTPVISIPNNPTLPGTTVTVATDLQVNRNLNVNGNITIGGTSATLFTETLKISDPDIILGFRTDANGNDISNDTTASHGGIAIASTEGTPLVSIIGAGETLPITYKKIMWFESGAFTGLATDAWLTNYAFGVGTTSMSAGTKFAVGNIETDFDDIKSVRNINASGISTLGTVKIDAGIITSTTGTAVTYFGNLTGTASTASFATTAFTLDGRVESEFNVATATTATNLSNAANITAGTISSDRLTGSYGIDITGTATTATNLSNAANITAGTISSDRLTGSYGIDITGTATTATNLSNAANITAGTISSDRLTGSYGIDITGTATTATNLSNAANITAGTISSDRLTGSYGIDITGTASTASFATTAFNLNSPETFSVGFATTATNVIGGIGSLTSLSVNTTGISTLGLVKISAGIVTATSGIVTYYGDGQYLQNISSGGGGGDTYQFNTGITSSFSAVLTGLGNTILSLPSTAGKQYIVYSIHASNVAAGNTEVNVTGSFDFNGGERSYFAYSLPIPTGVGLELLVEPQILNPSDQILMRGLDYNRNGTDDIVEVYVTYQEKTSDEYISVGLGTIGIDSTDPIGIYTSSSYPSVIQSIRLINRTDSGAYPISVSVANGVNTIRLVNNLIVPKYASVEILETPKRLNLNDVLNVQVNQTETIDVQISGQQIR